ncbi:hypothetical protein HZS_1431 [Henneguya salminicola]|nr:hypothetical protein HZS_1431 [Henneguya salminicola]
MHYNGHTFIDGSFRRVPVPFTQCLIIMVHDIETELFIPAESCLLTGKNKQIYCNVLHEIIVLVEYA